MMKKLLSILVVMVLMTAVGCKKRAEEMQLLPEATSEPAVTETVESIAPGIEDSEFGDETVETTVPTEADTPEQDDIPQETDAPEQTETPEREEAPQETREPEKTEEPSQDDIPQNTTEPEKPQETEPDNTQPEAEKPTDTPETETTVPSTEATETPEENGGDSTGTDLTEYEKFHALSPEEQQQYVESFEDIDQFFDWYNSSKEEYEAANPPIDVGDGEIDMGEIIDGNS